MSIQKYLHGSTNHTSSELLEHSDINSYESLLIFSIILISTIIIVILFLRKIKSKDSRRYKPNNNTKFNKKSNYIYKYS